MDAFGRFSPSHKAPARKGRRANNPQSDSINISTPEDDFTTSDDFESSAPGSSARVGILSSPTKVSEEAPPRSRKTGGWADEISSSKSGKEKFPQSPDTPQKIGSDDDIPLIPDLDELQDEEMLTQVARAPSVIGSKLASFVELDSDLMKHSALSTLDDINLSAISCRLYPETDVKEVDNAWTWDLLFTEVASDLRTEWENSNGTDVSVL